MSDLQSDALFILLVEKDAAFMRLAEDRFYNTYPCIILTAKGQPDVASRFILHCPCVTTNVSMLRRPASTIPTPAIILTAKGLPDVACMCPLPCPAVP